MSAFTLHVPGRPVPKQRPKVGHGRGYTPPETVEYENRVRAAWIAAGAPRLEGQLRATIELTPDGATVTVEEIPVAKSKLRGDADNYAKAILDAIQNHTDRKTKIVDEGAYKDDRQVHQLVVVKQ